MTHARQSHHLHRLDRAHNMARFYRLDLEPTLFAMTSVVRHWGRIGARGQCKIDLFNSPGEALAHMARLAQAKRRKGYREV